MSGFYTGKGTRRIIVQRETEIELDAKRKWEIYWSFVLLDMSGRKQTKIT
jgi:hypothetical protein